MGALRSTGPLPIRGMLRAFGGLSRPGPFSCGFCYGRHARDIWYSTVLLWLLLRFLAPPILMDTSGQR